MATTRRPKKAPVELMLDGTQRDALERAADRSGIDLATYCREAALETARRSEARDAAPLPLLVRPILVELAPDLTDAVLEDGSFMGSILPSLREGLFLDLGVRCPPIEIRTGVSDLQPATYRISIDEIPRATASLTGSSMLVGTPVEASWTPAGAVAHHLSRVLRRSAYELVGLQEVKDMVEEISRSAPALVEETVGKAVSLFQLTDILRRLVEEQVSIKNLRTIFYTLAEWGPVEQDTVMLTEYVRAALKREISHRFSGGRDVLGAYVIEKAIEDAIRESIQWTKTGAYLLLDPVMTKRILEAIHRTIAAAPPDGPAVIVTTMECRRYVWKLVEIEVSNVAVLSYHEISADKTLQPIAQIRLDAPEPEETKPAKSSRPARKKAGGKRANA